MDLVNAIAQTDAMEIDSILKAVLKRYAELFPEWHISTISLEKATDRNVQIDRIIAMLEKMKIKNDE